MALVNAAGEGPTLSVARGAQNRRGSAEQLGPKWRRKPGTAWANRQGASIGTDRGRVPARNGFPVTASGSMAGTLAASAATGAGIRGFKQRNPGRNVRSQQGHQEHTSQRARGYGGNLREPRMQCATDACSCHEKNDSNPSRPRSARNCEHKRTEVYAWPGLATRREWGGRVSGRNDGTARWPGTA